MPPEIEGYLIDIDGVLITGNQRIPGALEAISYLQEKHLPFLLVTNTTRNSRITIWHQLKRLGFPVEANQVLTAPFAAIQWLRKKKADKIYLFLSGSAVNDFKEFKITAANPDYLVVGDMGQDLTFERLNMAFRLVMGGAKIVALQKNRYWQTSEGLTLDAGAVVAALEYATNTRAVIVGKPRRDFFAQGAAALGLPLKKLGMVGDDLESDIAGSQKAGMTGIAVKTGKYRQNQLKKLGIKPDFTLKSIGNLPEFIDSNQGESK
ncbi:MAG: TIGR01458 family HAD-type hydrolase [Calditrichia bacterium]